MFLLQGEQIALEVIALQCQLVPLTNQVVAHLFQGCNVTEQLAYLLLPLCRRRLCLFLPGRGRTQFKLQGRQLITQRGGPQGKCRALGRRLFTVVEGRAQLTNQIDVANQNDHQRHQENHHDDHHDVGKRRPNTVLVSADLP